LLSILMFDSKLILYGPVGPHTNDVYF